MAAFDSLPILLVSATNEATATAVISDIIDNDVTDEFHNNAQSPDRVWRLVNKYYTAYVRVHPLVDGARLQVNSDAIEAHVIHITEEESTDSNGEQGVDWAERRAADSCGAWRRSDVRVLLAAARPALRAWAAHARAELQPRTPAGLRRARAALHAHVWSGLQRTDRAARATRSTPPESSESSSGGSDDSEADELRAVEHAEAFAAALGSLGSERALGPSPAPPGPGPGPAPGPEAHARAGPEAHARAEALVAAFCRALGYDLDAC